MEKWQCVSFTAVETAWLHVVLSSFLNLRELVLQFSNRGVYLWVYINMYEQTRGIFYLMFVLFVFETLWTVQLNHVIYNLFIKIQSCVICQSTLSVKKCGWNFRIWFCDRLLLFLPIPFDCCTDICNSCLETRQAIKKLYISFYPVNSL